MSAMLYQIQISLHCSVQWVKNRWGKRHRCFPRFLAIRNIKSIKRKRYIRESVFCFLTQCFMVILHTKVAMQRNVKEEDLNFSQDVNAITHCWKQETMTVSDFFLCQETKISGFLDGRMRIHQRVKGKTKGQLVLKPSCKQALPHTSSIL